MAGSYLFERVIVLATEKYQCYRDKDFPRIVLLSFPFSEMLTQEKDPIFLAKELSESLSQLRKSGSDILAIACNTLHLFLDEKDDLNDLIHLPKAVKEALSLNEEPLVFCTSTARQSELHRRFFPCVYPDTKVQFEIDEIIQEILKGCEKEVIIERLLRVIEQEKAKTIILGCTELSLFFKYLKIANKKIIDPLEILAKKILEKSFGGSYE
jgi:aspartate racemase